MARTNQRHLRAALDHYTRGIKEVDEKVVAGSVSAGPILEPPAEPMDVVTDTLEIVEARQRKGVMRQANGRRAHERDAMVDLLAAKPHPVVTDLIGELEAQALPEELRHRRETVHVQGHVLAALGTNPCSSGSWGGVLVGGHPVEQLEAMAAGSLNQRRAGNARLPVDRLQALAASALNVAEGLVQRRGVRDLEANVLVADPLTVSEYQLVMALVAAQIGAAVDALDFTKPERVVQELDGGVHVPDPKLHVSEPSYHVADGIGWLDMRRDRRLGGLEQAADRFA